MCCVREGRVRRAPHKAAASVYPQPPPPRCVAAASLHHPAMEGEEAAEQAEVLQVWVTSSVWRPIPKGL